MLELWGNTCPEDTWLGDKRGKGPCRYTASCKISKKDLESAVKGGHVINVENLSEKGEKNLYVVS